MDTLATHPARARRGRSPTSRSRCWPRASFSIISKWAGHYDSALTMKTYVHADDDVLKQGRQALAKIHRIA